MYCFDSHVAAVKEDVDIKSNQIKSSICKAPLKQSSQRRLLWVGLHKESSLKARLELFATNTTVLEMRWQHVPNLRCRDAETARNITRSPSTWYNHVIVVSTAKPRTKGNRDDRWTDVAEVHWWLAMDAVFAVVCHQRNFERNALRHGQPVKSVAQCWRDVVISSYQHTMQQWHRDIVVSHVQNRSCQHWLINYISDNTIFLTKSDVHTISAGS